MSRMRSRILGKQQRVDDMAANLDLFGHAAAAEPAMRSWLRLRFCRAGWIAPSFAAPPSCLDRPPSRQTSWCAASPA